MNEPILDRPRLPALTSVRYLAAVWVAMFHMIATNAFHFGAAPVRQLVSVGYSGVSFFFVLSGFILVYTYSGRNTNMRAFWQSRFARIYPALAFALLLTCPGFFHCCAHMRAHDPKLFVPEWAWVAPHMGLAAVLTLTLTESWIPQAALAWNAPTWSLSVEAFSYLLFPFLLPRMERLSRRQLMAIVPAGWLLALGCSLAYMHFHLDGIADNPLSNAGAWLYALKYHPLMHLPEFLMGMATGLLFLRGKQNRGWAWPLVLAGLGAIAAVVALSPWIPMPVIHTALLGPAFAVLIYGIALRPVGLSVLETRFMVALGDASYPFYLLHGIVINAFSINWFSGQPKHQTALGFFAWLAIASLVALEVDYAVERPLRRLLRPKKRPTATGPVTVPA